MLPNRLNVAIAFARVPKRECRRVETDLSKQMLRREAQRELFLSVLFCRRKKVPTICALTTRGLAKFLSENSARKRESVVRQPDNGGARSGHLDFRNARQRRPVARPSAVALNFRAAQRFTESCRHVAVRCGQKKNLPASKARSAGREGNPGVARRDTVLLVDDGKIKTVVVAKSSIGGQVEAFGV